jgi:hypothetical protein
MGKLKRTIGVDAAAGPKDVDGDGYCEAVGGGDADSEIVGDDRISVLFIFGEGALAFGGGDNGSPLDMEAEGIDAPIGPMGDLEESVDDEERNGLPKESEGLTVPVLVGIDALVLSGFGGEVEGNCALWLGCVFGC